MSNDGANQGAKIAGIGIGAFFGLLALVLLVVLLCCGGMMFFGIIGAASETSP